MIQNYNVFKFKFLLFQLDESNNYVDVPLHKYKYFDCDINVPDHNIDVCFHKKILNVMYSLVEIRESFCTHRREASIILHTHIVFFDSM